MNTRWLSGRVAGTGPVLQRYWLHGRLLWRSAPGLSVVCLVLTLVQAAAGTAALITTGRLVGSVPAAVHAGLGSAAATRLWWWLVATAVVLVAGPVAASTASRAGRVVAVRYLVIAFDLTAEAGLHPYGVAPLEEPELAGRFDALAKATSHWLFVSGVESTWDVIGARLGGVGAFVVLATWRWWAPFAGVAGWLVMSGSFSRYINSVWDSWLEAGRRKATYHQNLLTGGLAGKEVRLFGLTSWLVDRYTAAWREAMRIVWRRRGRSLRITMSTLIFGAITSGAVFAVLAGDAWRGAVSVGSVVTLAQAILSLGAFGPGGDAQTAMTRTTAAVAKLVQLRAGLGLPPLAVSSPPSAAVAALPGDGERALPVELREVTFTYPSRDEPTIGGLSLQIPAGQSVAIVGVNGAGKSTLIKLLCGLYRPDSGAVRLDGRDPGTDEGARRQVAVIFQDFVHYPLPLRDNVGFGAVGRLGDQPVLDTALSGAGGAGLLDRLDAGWDTVLSAEYEGGTDLSGGQWQLVALARALAAVEGGARLLILDEPTAALDVRAEAALFDRFLEVTRGVTTILVSHRLSSVRHADRIVVIGRHGSGGARVIEDGSHEELLAAGGAYARLFGLQAARFAAAGDTGAGTDEDEDAGTDEGEDAGTDEGEDASTDDGGQDRGRREPAAPMSTGMRVPKRTSLRAIWILIAVSVRVSPWQALASLAEPASQLIQALQPLYMAWFVVGAIHHNLRDVIVAAAAFAASSGLAELLWLTGTHARLLQMERVGFAFDTQIATITGRLPTLDHLESPRYLDELQTLRDQEGALGQAINSLLLTMNHLVFVGVTLTLAAGADWRLLLVAAAGVPMVIGTRWTIVWQAAAEKISAPLGRLTGSLIKLTLTAGPGAELRVFGLGSHMRARLREATAAWRAPMVQLARRESMLETGGNVLFFGVAGGVLAWMTHDAIAGTVSLPVLTLALMLIGRLQGTSNGLMWSMRNVSQLVRTARRYLWLEDYEKGVRRAHPGTAAPPAVLRQGIRLEGVTYRYPESQTAAVENIDLDLPAGSVVALVGENGAGKSTLVKLLTGMYQPTAGKVLIDGTDLATMDVDAWRARSSGAFQDYAKLEFLLAESVGAGHLPQIHDEDRVRQALRDGASEELLDSAPHGLATQLGSTWPGGVDLSGGQWQRLAIARGMMRDQPLLLVLDEPTAALDADTEHALFDQYAKAARQAGRHGGLTLLVTHRFSTVSAADLVVVLHRGQVAEIGTHTELVKAGGRYAELYQLQARGYR